MFVRRKPENLCQNYHFSNNLHRPVAKCPIQSGTSNSPNQKRYYEQVEDVTPESSVTISAKDNNQEMEVETESKVNANEVEGDKKNSENHLSVSATTKALNQMEVDGEEKKLKWSRQGGKISNKLKRRKMNEKLAKILIPKNPLILLHEMKPDCYYITKEASSQGNMGFFVQVKHGNDILGNGQGLSKSQAKSLAAENAIKTLFSKAVKSISEEGQTQREDAESTVVFPWAGLAQFAMYKMFNEWQLQGSDLPPNDIQKFLNFAKGSKPTPNLSQPKKELPPDAEKLHPTAVLNNLYPGLPCIELERTIGPPSHVKMAFVLDGKQYCGVATNKKEAKKEAAKVLLSTVYGVKYES